MGMLLFIDKMKRGAKNMSKSKHQQEKEWKDRKQSQNPHGKVRSFEQLSEDTQKDDNK